MFAVKNMIFPNTYAFMENLNIDTDSRSISFTYTVVDVPRKDYSCRVGTVEIRRNVATIPSVKSRKLSFPPETTLNRDSYLLLGPGTGVWEGSQDCIMMATVIEDRVYWSALTTSEPFMVEDEDIYIQYRGVYGYEEVDKSKYMNSDQWNMYFSEEAIASAGGNLHRVCANYICDNLGLDRETHIIDVP